MRMISVLAVILVMVAGSVSCSLYFREHFFLPGEAVTGDELSGTWNLIEVKDAPGPTDDEQTRLIFTRPSGGTIDFILKRIQRKGRNVDSIPYLGKTYSLGGKKFLVAWEIIEQGANGKKRKINDSCNILHYQVKDDTMIMCGLNKEKFEKLVSGGKLEGYASGGGGYNGKTFHITSAGSKVRGAVLSAGIEALIEFDKPTEFRRNRNE